MSMIENQIKQLERLKASLVLNCNDNLTCKELRPHLQAIDDAISTIQGLSAKLAAANMERSSTYYNSGWIPITYHETTPDDGIDMNEYPLCFDCLMPDDGQDVLITTKIGYVEKDVCCIDDGFYLDSGYDWTEDVVAWMPLPEPYREEQNE